MSSSSRKNATAPQTLKKLRSLIGYKFNPTKLIKQPFSLGLEVPQFRPRHLSLPGSLDYTFGRPGNRTILSSPSDPRKHRGVAFQNRRGVHKQSVAKRCPLPTGASSRTARDQDLRSLKGKQIGPWTVRILNTGQRYEYPFFIPSTTAPGQPSDGGEGATKVGPVATFERPRRNRPRILHP